MQEHTYGVAELGTVLGRLLGQAFPGTIWVRGQIRNLSRASSGHVYLDLCEPGALGAATAAQIPVMLRSADRPAVNAALKAAGVRGLRMEDGIEVRIAGRMAWYSPTGRMQLRMTGIDPTYTLGRLAQDRERLLAALTAEGLLDRNGRLPLPSLPGRVGLVTSLGSAAHADFVHELERAGVGLCIIEVGARMQGVDAAYTVPAAIAAVVAAGAEIVAVVRGGGSRTDLAAFDSEAIARAIATAPVPVLTGIGHETDRSVADDVAHTSFKTPTACAAFLAHHVLDAVEGVEARWEAVTHLSHVALDRAAERLQGRAQRTGRAVSGGLAGADRAVAEVTHRVARDARRALDDCDRRLEGAEARRRALDPALALARGWSITRDGQGRVVRDASDVSAGDVLVTQLGRGTVRSAVETTDA